MTKFLTMLLFIGCLSVHVLPVNAGVPQTINYRGRLIDASGSPVADGANFITFSIYSAPTGGTALWTSGIQAVTTDGGLFSYEFGANVNLPPDLFSANSALYLGIQIGVDPEIAPRTKFGSSAFALQAEHADLAAEAITAGSADIAIEAQKLGNQAPSYYLDWNNLTGLPAGFADGVDNVDTDWNNLTNVPAGFADGVDNGGIGDITGVTAGSGLTGGGGAGDVTVGVAQNGITSFHLAPGSVTTQELANGSVRALKLADSSVYANNIYPGSIGSEQILDQGVQARDIKSGTITANQIGVGAIVSNNIADGTLTANDLAPNSVTSSEIATGAVTSAEIADGSVTPADLSFTPGDITGVAAGNGLAGGGTLGSVSLSLAPTISQNETFTRTVFLNGATIFNDSSMRVDRSGISIGANTIPSPATIIYMNRTFNSAGIVRGLDVRPIVNTGSGDIYGVDSRIGVSTSQGSGRIHGVYGLAGMSGASGTTGRAYGVEGRAIGGASSTSPRYGVLGTGGDNSNTRGSSYGVYGQAYSGAGSTAYGVYGWVGGMGTRYAGWFEGDVQVVGTLSKSAGSFKIDHPLDPVNKYLQHSFVESPDMMNVYNGNVVTDANGDATVTLPLYFEALNRDFRYQLTVVGVFAQAIVSEKMSGNQFSIKTDKSNVEVSWQVTGIRQDAYANAHRIEVEVDKPAKERGLYMHPVAHGLSEKLQLHYEQNKKAQEPPADTRGQ